MLNDKVTCANADLKADIERWHINKRKDFRKLFVNMADRQICYFQKVSALSSLLKFVISDLLFNWQYSGAAVWCTCVKKMQWLNGHSVMLDTFS